MGFLVIRAYRYERRSENILDAENRSASKRETTLLLRRTMNYSTTAWLQIIKTMLIFLLGLWLIHLGQMDVGGLIATVQLAALIGSPIEVLAYLLHARNEALPLLETYEKYALCPPGPVGEKLQDFSKISLGRVNFSVEGVPILRDVSAEFYAGKKYLITGESGSGKSTLLRLIAQAEDHAFSGHIRLDRTDVDAIDADAYSSLVCSVFQEPYLFYASLEENILLGRDIPRSRYLEIVRKLNLDYLLERYHGQDLTPRYWSNYPAANASVWPWPEPSWAAQKFIC